MDKKLKDKVDSLPQQPGVYIFKDNRGSILYIGKAKSLKKRVQSYFGRPLSEKNQVMAAKIYDLEYILTSTEAQAEIREAALVRDNQPPYNISLKDDKSFPWLRITGESFPVVSIVRIKKRQRNDRSIYFGPYTNVKLLRQAIKLIRRIFGFRSCSKMPRQPCLYYRLKLCPAPCAKKISRTRYQEIIRQITMFLESRYTDLLRQLSIQMHKAARERRFEEAAQIRDRISALSAIVDDEINPGSIGELEGLKNLLGLKKLPERIEAFDISNISGKEATGSMVSFYRGYPDKNNYRRFRIKTIQTIDDYRMLAEVIQRRYSRLIREGLPFPDLILVDGGRAHLLTAKRELDRLGLDIPLASIAKDRENIYVKEKDAPIHLDSDTPALNLIRRLRDEAHRFAVVYHHLLRRKKVVGR